MTIEALKRVFFILAVALSMGTLAACDDGGPAEQAGEAVDDAAEEAADAVKDATN